MYIAVPQRNANYALSCHIRRTRPLPCAIPHLREMNVNRRAVVMCAYAVRLLPLSDARGARRLLRKQYCLDTITRRNRDRSVE